MKKLTSISMLIVILMASACVTATTTPIPTTSVSTVSGEEAADDIIFTPGGPVYRANLHQQGVTNPWLPIESSEVVLSDNINIINLRYREYIETRAGESRNNILAFRIPGGDISHSLDLYTGYIPSGIDVKESMRGGRPFGIITPVLIIEIAHDVKPGEYTFEIGLEIGSRDYGTVPCTIKVIE